MEDAIRLLKERTPEWASEALRQAPLTRFRARMPREVYLSEARRLADLLDRDREALLAVGLAADMSDQIRWLCTTLERYAPYAQLMSTPEERARVAERAEVAALTTELRRVLEWRGKQPGYEELGLMAQKYRSKHRRGKHWPTPVLALQLLDLVDFAAKHADDLDGLGGFDITRLDTIRPAIHRLVGFTGPPSWLRSIRVCRERWFHALGARVKEGRDTGRFAFRADPARKADYRSAWQARQTAKRRNRRSPPPSSQP